MALVPTASAACDGGSSEIIIRHKAAGVAAVRFEFHDGSAADSGLGFNVYREICILGSPTSLFALVSLPCDCRLSEPAEEGKKQVTKNDHFLSMLRRRLH